MPSLNKYIFKERAKKKERFGKIFNKKTPKNNGLPAGEEEA
jgi:hypothetical protein